MIALCLFHLHYKFSAHNDQVILLCFRRYLFLWFKSFTNSRVWCEWVLFNCSQLTWQVAKWGTRVKHAEKMNSHASWSTTGQKVQFGSCVCSRLELATQSSREAKSPANSVLKNLTLCIPFSLQYKYPLYPRNIESFQREYWERNPREKQDWLIHNLHIETLQIPLLSPSPLLYPWKVHYQNLFSPYPHL